jgi:uncharacterized protein with PIN domain
MRIAGSTKRTEGKMKQLNVFVKKESINGLYYESKFPRCPNCGAVNGKGLKRTKMGNVMKGHQLYLRCQTCNSMFLFDIDINNNYKPIIIKEVK